MEKRKSYWYSIIKYIADFTKGEPLNVGIYLESSDEKKIKYILIEDNNLKLKSIFENKLQRDTYKYGKDYFEYLLSKMIDGSYPTDSATDNFISFFSKQSDLPKGFIFSEPQFAKTDNCEKLFENLKFNYIGYKFLNDTSETRDLLVKQRANTIFDNAKLLNNKLKTNVKISPSPSLPFKYQIDFAFRKTDKIDLIQAAPGNIDLLPDWFEKINVFSTNYKDANHISLLYDSSVDEQLFADTKSVINILTKADDKVQAIDINNSKNDGITKFVESIKNEALDVQELNDFIA